MAHIRYAGPEAVLDALVDRYPILAPQKEGIRALYELIHQSFASGGKLRPLCDVSVVVGVSETFMVQELHLPVYHALCLMLEYAFFSPAQ